MVVEILERNKMKYRRLLVKKHVIFLISLFFFSKIPIIKLWLMVENFLVNGKVLLHETRPWGLPRTLYSLTCQGLPFPMTNSTIWRHVVYTCQPKILPFLWDIFNFSMGLSAIGLVYQWRLHWWLRCGVPCKMAMVS